MLEGALRCVAAQEGATAALKGEAVANPKAPRSRYGYVFKLPMRLLKASAGYEPCTQKTIRDLTSIVCRKCAWNANYSAELIFTWIPKH